MSSNVDLSRYPLGPPQRMLVVSALWTDAIHQADKTKKKKKKDHILK